MRDSARLRALVAVVVGVALLVVAAIGWLGPKLKWERPALTSTPAPFDWRDPTKLVLAPESRACMADVAIDPESRQAWLGVIPIHPPTELVLTLEGPGYRARTTLPPANADGVIVTPVRAPERPLEATVCVENAGRTATELSAIADPRVVGRVHATVDGAEQQAAFRLVFLEGEPTTMLERLPQTFERAASLSAAGPWLYWLLLPLLVLGVPACLLGALWLGFRDEPDR